MDAIKLKVDFCVAIRILKVDLIIAVLSFRYHKTYRSSPKVSKYLLIHIFLFRELCTATDIMQAWAIQSGSICSVLPILLFFYFSFLELFHYYAGNVSLFGCVTKVKNFPL